MTASPPTDEGGHEPGTRVPPGVLLLVDDEPDDRTLVEIARMRPGGLSALAAVAGVGEGKLARYGDAVLQVLGEAAAVLAGAGEAVRACLSDLDQVARAMAAPRRTPIS